MIKKQIEDIIPVAPSEYCKAQDTSHYRLWFYLREGYLDKFMVSLDRERTRSGYRFSLRNWETGETLGPFEVYAYTSTQRQGRQDYYVDASLLTDLELDD